MESAMKWHKSSLEIPTRGKGLYAFTGQVNAQIHAWSVREGMCFLFCPHTSASLTINGTMTRLRRPKDAWNVSIRPCNP